MRILAPSSLSEGYEPGGIGLNHEEGILEIHAPSSCQLEDETDSIPETLILRCALRPVALLHKDMAVQFISENVPLDRALLYERDTVVPGYGREVLSSQWAGIIVDYGGKGQAVIQKKSFDFSGTTLPIGELSLKTPLYLKPFCTEASFWQCRATTIRPGQVLSSPPGVLNARLLRPYGGYYRPGIPLTEIEQVYYTLTSEYEKTKVRLYSSTLLKTQHIAPPLGGREHMLTVLFSPPPQEEEYLSLPAALAAGYARFSVHTEFGNLSYESSFCESVRDHPSFVSVHFKPLR